MKDLDTALARLKDLPADTRLESIDDSVLAAVAARHRGDAPGSTVLFGAAAGLALSIGLLAAAIPDREARAASITPFGAPPALAPSSLLGTGE